MNIQPNSSTPPLISVAMCTYNGARFLQQQLQSILEQSYRNIEVIIRDDCSIDSTLEILEEFKKKDPRIKVFQNEENIGFIKNFEKAIGECRGEYIALSDQDDIWLPKKLETLIHEIRENLVVYSKVDIIDENSDRKSGAFPRVNRLEGFCTLSLIFDNCVTGHTCLIQRDLLKIAIPFPNALFSHDQWLAAVAATQGRLKASQQVLSLYRVHGKNTIVANKKREKSKSVKNQKKLKKTIDLAQYLHERKLLSEQDQILLGELITLLKTNYNCIYNTKLARFLDRNSDKFLQLYQKPKKAIRKICRGQYYFKVADVMSYKFRASHNQK